MSESADAIRKRQQRERTAKHRAKVKEKEANDLAGNEQKSRDEFDAWRVSQRLVSPGEVSAFVNAENCVDALAVAREFLLALGEPDVKPEESLLDVERRVVSAWVEQGTPLLNRKTLRLDTSVASTADGFTFDFDTRWVAIDGANEVIDISTLPVIEVPEVPAVDTPAIVDTVTVEDTAAPTTEEEQLAMEHRHQTGLCRVSPQEALMLKTQQDAMDAKAREISAANLERELKNERRLGDAYIPSSELHFRNSREC